MANNPVLLRVETKAGHGSGKPVSKVIDEQADIYAFVFKTLNMSYGNTGETHACAENFE